MFENIGPDYILNHTFENKYSEMKEEKTTNVVYRFSEGALLWDLFFICCIQ